MRLYKTRYVKKRYDLKLFKKIFINKGYTHVKFKDTDIINIMELK